MMKEFTIAEVAEKYHRDRSNVLRWIKAKKFPNARMIIAPIGNYWMIPETDLKNFRSPRRGPQKSGILDSKPV